MFSNTSEIQTTPFQGEPNCSATILHPSTHLKLASQLRSAQVCYERPAKRQKVLAARSPTELPAAFLISRKTSIYLQEPQRAWIEHWVEHKFWPLGFFSFQGPAAMSDQVGTDPVRNLAIRLPGQSADGDTLLDENLASDAQTGNTPKSRRVAYQDSSFDRILQDKGSFMREHERGCSQESETMVAKLLERKVGLPENLIYTRPKWYQHKIERLQRKNETKVDRELLLALIPSAEDCWDDEAGEPRISNILIETSNEEWESCDRLHRLPRPQPDYSAGFQWGAFSESQQAVLKTYSIDLDAASPSPFTAPFTASAEMLFPFMSCEVKGSGGTLLVAANQNGNTMTVALRGICKLFELANMYESIDGMIIGFAFAFNALALEIWGHYPRADANKKVKLYRRKIKRIYLEDDSDANKWGSYRFAKALWDEWAPNHLKMLQEAVDKLPVKRLPSSALSQSNTSKASKRQWESSGTSILSKKQRTASMSKESQKPNDPPFTASETG